MKEMTKGRTDSTICYKIMFLSISYVSTYILKLLYNYFFARVNGSLFFTLRASRRKIKMNWHCAVPRLVISVSGEIFMYFSTIFSWKA